MGRRLLGVRPRASGRTSPRIVSGAVAGDLVAARGRVTGGRRCGEASAGRRRRRCSLRYGGFATSSGAGPRGPASRGRGLHGTGASAGRGDGARARVLSGPADFPASNRARRSSRHHDAGVDVAVHAGRGRRHRRRRAAVAQLDRRAGVRHPRRPRHGRGHPADPGRARGYGSTATRARSPCSTRSTRTALRRRRRRAAAVAGRRRGRCRRAGRGTLAAAARTRLTRRCRPTTITQENPEGVAA